MDEGNAGVGWADEPETSWAPDAPVKTSAQDNLTCQTSKGLGGSGLLWGLLLASLVQIRRRW